MRLALVLLLTLPTVVATADDVTDRLADRFTGHPVQWEHCSWVPAAARTLRHQNRNWATDLDILNTGGSAARVSVALLERDKINTSSRIAAFVAPVEAGETVHIDDVVDFVLVDRWQAWLGGLVVCADAPGVEATSRSYLVDVEEETTVGQGIPGLDLGDAIRPGDVGHLVGLREDDHYRSNLGLMNPNPTATDVRIRLLDETGATLLVIVYDLQPYGQIQYNRILSYFDLGVTRARAEVTATDLPVFAYGTLVDNETSDPSYIACRVGGDG